MVKYSLKQYSFILKFAEPHIKERYIMKFTHLLVLSFFLLSCVSQVRKENPNSNRLTYGNVKTKIIKGTTTQAEILQDFGSPNLVTKNKDNDEVWNYNKMSFERIEGTDTGTAIFWSGSKAVSISTTKSFDLIIIFNENDVVKNYSVIQASF